MNSNNNKWTKRKERLDTKIDISQQWNRNTHCIIKTHTEW